MSAIAAILRFGCDVDLDEIQCLISSMHHRGPDGAGVWVQGSLALAQAMMRTTPEARDEKHVVAVADQRVRLVWDGRLDNREQVLCDLRSHGVDPPVCTDPDLVAHLYLVYREKFLERLFGDFALILWDSCTRELHCARDVMGARSLSFAVTSELIAFATDEDALACLSEIEMTPNEELVASLFVPGLPILDESIGWNRNAVAVDPGQVITVDSSGRRRSRIFRSLAQPPLASFRSVRDASDAFVSVFQDALRCRMRSTIPPVTLMSGGMDSAAIVALAGPLLSGNESKSLCTFSAISELGESCVESAAIRELMSLPHVCAKSLPVPRLTRELPLPALSRLAWDQAHPVDNSLLLVQALGTMACSFGRRVLLHGAAGDLATHTTNGYIAIMLRQGLWMRAFNEMRLAASFHTYLRHRSIAVICARSIAAAFAPREFRRAVASFRLSNGAVVRSLGDIGALSAELQARLDVAGRCRAKWRETTASGKTDWRNDDFDAAKLIRHGLAGFDRASAKVGIEARDPWADQRVVEFFLSLPLQLKVSNGRTKHLVRTACSPLLPDSVCWRSDKEHVGWKLTKALMDAARPHLVAELEIYADVVRPYLDLDGARLKFREFAQRDEPALRDFCFNVLTLIRWLAPKSAPLRLSRPSAWG